ncbi:hypothetical protein GCM10018954_008320 [Kutzneria kofuensis]
MRGDDVDQVHRVADGRHFPAGTGRLKSNPSIRHGGGVADREALRPECLKNWEMRNVMTRTGG